MVKEAPLSFSHVLAQQAFGGKVRAEVLHPALRDPDRRYLQALAQLRLQEAEALFPVGFFDGCAYLCGYVVELALKARICATLGLNEYPEKGSRLKDAFRTHDFDDLKLLAGMEHEFSASRPVLLSNWSIASKWKLEQRYDPL